ncbi:hypothetical protein GCM10017786_36660 [Amycolatopsis deserti]|uniref:Heme-binding protein n=1 Tax=Amycolatopsis deserti TaxID=185696 RepID=A0ABQ3J2F0_9PSEU|nr:heme-binding protein [Amycolatopsis deserti]GHF00481.1 hypothetical protein GCM10017786_36660 [Amycolatopsis deserti]
MTNGGLVIFGGGIPLVRGREVIGAIGVSAGSVEQDTAGGEAGVAALPKRGAADRVRAMTVWPIRRPPTSGGDR